MGSIGTPCERPSIGYLLPWGACARRGVGIAGCRLYLPINGTTNNSWAGNPTGQVGTIGISGRAATGSYLAAGFGCEVAAITTGSKSLDLPTFINGLAANAPCILLASIRTHHRRVMMSGVF